jgi:hypothetical protein
VIGPTVASGAAGWKRGRGDPETLIHHRPSEYPQRNLHRTRRGREPDASCRQGHPGTKALNSGVWGGPHKR